MRRTVAASLALGAATLATRIGVAGQLPTEWDSVNLILGVDRFDVRQDSPHAPGYWLYVLAGRMVRALTPFDTNRSLVLVAALASAGVVVVTYLAARDIGGEWFALGAAALVATSPFMWFYGAVAASYSFDALVGMILLLLAVRARPGSRHGVVAAGVLGLAAGFRPTMVVLFSAVAVVVAVRAIRSWRAAALAAAAGTAGVLAWLVPMLLEQPGGLSAWSSASHDIFVSAARSTSLLTGSPQGWNNMARAGAATAIAATPALIVGTTAVVLRLALGPRSVGRRRQGLLSPVLLATATPGLLFVALTHFPKSGYALAFLPPLVVLALLPAARLGGVGRIVTVAVMAVVSVANVQRFLMAPGVVPLSLVDRHGLWVAESRLGAPFSVTRAEIRRVDATSRRYLQLRKVIDPETELVVFDLSHTPGNYRYATYALPEYRMNLVGGGIEWRSSWHRQQRFVTNHQITVPRGGDAVLAMDQPTGDVDDLIARGLASRLSVPGGPALVRVKTGATLFGLPVVEGGPEPYTP